MISTPAQGRKCILRTWQASRAKWHAICMIEGASEDSFTRLPRYFYSLDQQSWYGDEDFGSIDLDQNQRQVPSEILGRARKRHEGRIDFTLFQTFTSGWLHKVFIIHDAHLKGDYLGTMFLVVAMDSNNQVVPIAIDVAKSKSGEH
ncbi:hypothetical protein OSB04_025017 [Centaurea solstitialis]|uniref:Uncharacterized protein n=1 Tax=Centaurea solstitialis TaxID=347529 RepID=A0AA38SM93_9ASTR|nr:hypothetical protein OSB04_025017 [Centaurea solstitialis]